MPLLPEIDAKLIAYSVFANAFAIAGNSAIGQVVYTDINPDIVLDNNGDEFFLDINNDGISDFGFFNLSSSYQLIPSDTYMMQRQGLFVGAMISQNAIAGLSEYVEFTPSGFTRYYPYVVNQNNIIDSSMSWQNKDEQILALKNIKNGIDEIYDSAGNWNPGEIDKFIGIRFKDADNQKHYGWVRCDVLNEGKTLVIKDYAVELQSNQAIRAGSQETINNNILEANVFYHQDLIHIIFNARPVEYVFFSLFDLSGKEIYHTTLLDQELTIKAELLPGIYAVKMTSSTMDHGSMVFVK